MKRSNKNVVGKQWQKINLKEQRVSHSTLGEGTITSISYDIISIKFDNGSNKQFKYPSCFNSIIKILDNKTADKVASMLYEEKSKKQNKENDDTIVAKQTSQINQKDTAKTADLTSINYVLKNKKKAQKLLTLEGVKIKADKFTVKVSGNTYQHKELLKIWGFMWNSKKKCWVYDSVLSYKLSYKPAGTGKKGIRGARLWTGSFRGKRR